jgi:hypothetical protein
MCAFLAGALVTALMPMTASAQQTPTDQATLLTLLPGPMVAALQPAIMQVQSGQSTGDPRDAANAIGIYAKVFSQQMSIAQVNLINDTAMTQAANHTQNSPAAPSTATSMQIAADEAVIQELIALNNTVLGGS